MWDGVWPDLAPCLLTTTELKGGVKSHHKSRGPQLASRTAFDKLCEKGGLMQQEKIFI